jgi:hypothetical protein
MDKSGHLLRHVVIRTFIIAGVGIAFGYLVFRFAVFVPTMPPYQFTIASITVGLCYSMLKGSTLRNTLSVLLVWYFVGTTFSDTRHYWIWIMILQFAYVAGLSFAVYLYMFFIRKRYVRSMAIRIASFLVITAITNALIVQALALLSFPRVIAHPFQYLQASFYNLELGTMIGLALGIGIELGDYAIRRLSSWEENSERTNAN